MTENKLYTLGGGRNTLLDISKGIAIWLMVFGHSGLPSSLHDIIYSFHMPFFFLVSGILSQNCRPFGEYTKKKARSLLIPFLVYAIINVILRSIYYDESIPSYLWHHIYTGCESALWFIPVLFVVNILNNSIKNSVYLPAFVLISLSIQSIFTFANVNLPWSFSVFPFAFACVALGRYYNEYFKTILSMPLKYHICLSIICFSIITCISRYFVLELKDNTKTEPILILFTTAITGSIGLFSVSALLSKVKFVSKLLSYTGKNTMIILGLSQIVLKYENLYISQYAIGKYIILIILLYTLIYIKNKIPVLRVIKL